MLSTPKKYQNSTAANEGTRHSHWSAIVSNAHVAQTKGPRQAPMKTRRNHHLSRPPWMEHGNFSRRCRTCVHSILVHTITIIVEPLVSLAHAKAFSPGGALSLHSSWITPTNPRAIGSTGTRYRIYRRRTTAPQHHTHAIFRQLESTDGIACNPWVKWWRRKKTRE